MLPLPAIVDAASFLVSWTGSDAEDGSGLAAFHVFVSDNGGPFVPWLLGTQLTEAEFLGQEGHRYAFYSVAFDNAGNKEAVPTTPDAVTVTPGGTATIGDLVWSDTDGDGIQDEGETGLPDVTVRLYLDGRDRTAGRDDDRMRTAGTASPNWTSPNPTSWSSSRRPDTTSARRTPAPTTRWTAMSRWTRDVPRS